MTAPLTIERPQPLAPSRPTAPAQLRKSRRDGTTAMRAAINRHVGQRIRIFRLTRGATQAQLGAALGLTNQQVQKYEKGVNGLSFDRLWQVANYLGVSLEQLLDGVDAAGASVQAQGEAPSPERLENRRLRLEVADAILRARSVKMLRGMVQLLRTVEAEEAAASDQRQG